MRWKIILILFLPVLLGSCASRRHASSGKAKERPPHADSRTPGRKPPPSGNFSRSLHTEDYIRLYSALAVKEMERSGVPASITLAQGIHESGNGNSRLARQANNHFGIKCTSAWKGGKTYKDDDRRNECFRAYKSVEDSYRDHSEFLQRSRYRFLFDLDPTDYKGWAYGLKKAGYATNPRYPHLLIDLIERYELYRFDRKGGKREAELIAGNGGSGTDRTAGRTGSATGSPEREGIAPAPENPSGQAPAGTPSPSATGPSAGTGTTGDGNTGGGNAVGGNAAPEPAGSGAISHYYYTVKAGDTLYAISRRFNVSPDELKQWNGLSSNTISPGQQLRVSR